MPTNNKHSDDSMSLLNLHRRAVERERANGVVHRPESALTDLIDTFLADENSQTVDEYEALRHQHTEVISEILSSLDAAGVSTLPSTSPPLDSDRAVESPTDGTRIERSSRRTQHNGTLQRPGQRLDDSKSNDSDPSMESRPQ